MSCTLIFLGVALVLAAAVYLALGRLQMWVEAQDRYLEVEEVAALPESTATPTPAPTATPVPSATPVPRLTEPPAGPTEALVPLPTATFFTQPLPTDTPTPSPEAVPSPLPSPTPIPPLPVRIRIPAIGVDRSIVELAPVWNAQTGAYELPLKNLFRRPGTDLVGHWAGSASPGQAGNMILVGHNYGYGYNGVFLNAGRLKAGQVVNVVNQAGETFAYQVTAVKHVKWSKKNEQELLRHQSYLAMGGEERVTLVTCGGATWEPFPDRVYVVAEPVD